MVIDICQSTYQSIIQSAISKLLSPYNTELLGQFPKELFNNDLMNTPIHLPINSSAPLPITDQGTN